ncbi:hypothetical protein ENUP19_0347G0031 [Entamoeba nuttalli]|uniref:Exocyst complex component sec10, putative n=2 Tax=Entamoeba nuttalli TaxID=412467 RepID=K2H5E6_ENTNP|nr:exocyst complex component sec10, putative [Entamoeba nuttalli P19]EKE37654.1 exocyst complex component sec10, putative [Entamoeba nuttalli P19]|eukprot:XP_008860006.1 exocyst complex component sec10, putative [Entamoeba nuttalli P19]
MSKDNKEPVNLKSIEQRLQDTNVFLQSTFEPEIYIDSLLSEQCDYSIEKGIEAFDIDPILQCLNVIKSRIDNQFIAYKRSVEQLQEQCVHEEETHISTVTNAREKFNKALEEFKQTENGVSELSTDIMQAGERLQDLTVEANRGRQASMIIDMFTKFNKDNNFDPRKYTEEYPDIDFVTRIKKLKTLCKELQNPQTTLGIANTEKFYSYIENEYMKKFSTAMTEKNINEMKDYAELLYYLNGGDKCVKEYLKSNAFLYDEIDIRQDEQLAETDQEIDNKVCKINNQCLQAFLKKILNQIQKEKREIEKVFVQKDIVVAKYVQKIFKFRIANFYSVYVYKGYDEDPDFFWKYLFKCYDAYDQITNSFVKSLTSFGINGAFLSDLVERVFEEDKTSNYSETEISYIASVFKQNQDSYNANKKSIKIDNVSKLNMDGFSKIIEPTTIKNVCDQLSFALIRAQSLTLPDSFDYVISKLFTSLTQWLDYVLLDCCERMVYLTQKQPNHPDKSIPFLSSYLTLLDNICKSISLIQVMFEKNLTPCFKYSVQKLNEYNKQFKNKIQSIQSTLSTSIENLCNWLLNCIEKLMNYKNEFKFKDEKDETWVLNPRATSIGIEICKYLNNTIKIVNSKLTGLNKKNFLIRIAHGFHDLFIRTIKKLKITPISGGFVFMYDVSAICDTVRALKFPAVVRPMFENLSLLFKIFCTPKDQVILIANAILGDGGFKYVDPNDLFKCRTDFSKDMKIDLI